MNSNTLAIESFITFCDDMMIAEESFSSIKSKIVTLFSKLVLWIENKVKKMKDGKIKSTLMKLLSRAKRGLAKSKSLKEHNPDMVKELQEEYKEINEEVQEVVKEKGITPEFAQACKKSKVTRIRIMIKDSILLDAANGTNTTGTMMSYANRIISNGIMDNHNGDLIHDNPSDYTEDDYNKEAVAFISNFSKERYQMLRTVAKRLFSKK